jgi:hypothetical protein
MSLLLSALINIENFLSFDINSLNPTENKVVWGPQVFES